MKNDKFLPSIIIATAFVAGAVAFGWFYYSAQTEVRASQDGLSVTGSTKMRVTSDQAKLVLSLSRTVVDSELPSGYKKIANDLGLTRGLLKNSGLLETDWVESPVSMNQLYDQNNSVVIRYQLAQTVSVQSNDVAKMTDLSKKIPDLVGQGAMVSIQSLEYYYSKLPDLRVSLLTAAIQDAKARAAKIAEGTGRHIGVVQSASSGVVQVLAPNSVDVSDYGTYDTSSIEKDVMVAIKASFSLR